MHMLRAVIALPAVLLLASCNPAVTGSNDAGAGSPSSSASAAASQDTSTPGSSGALPVGPGPAAHYSVQSQPSAKSCHYRYENNEPLPDPSCTPGAVSPAVTQANIGATICRSGYTAEIRPSTSVTSAEKQANAESYDYTGTMRTAEYDHLISLQLGGDPNDERNLWVEPPGPGQRGTYNDKDRVETKLRTAVCSGKVPLAIVQRAIATHWTTALATLGLATS